MFSLKTRLHERWLDMKMAGRGHWQLSSVGRGKTTFSSNPRQYGHVQGSQARGESKAWLQKKEKMRMGIKMKRRKKEEVKKEREGEFSVN